MTPRTAFTVCALALLTGAGALQTREDVCAFERGDPSLEGSRSARHRTPTEEGLALARSWRGRDKRRAIQVLEERLDVLSRRDPERARTIRLRLGDLQRDLGAIEPALRYYRSVAEAASTPATAVAARLGMARTLLLREDHDGALSQARNALRMAKASTAAALEARALLVVGIVLYEQTRFEEALQSLGDAKVLADRLGDARTGTEAQLHIGFARSDMEDDDSAIVALESALDSSRSDGDRSLEAFALLGLGHTYSKLGEKERALTFYVRAKPIIEAMEDPIATASLDTGLGYLYTDLGDYENAERYYRRAVALNGLVRARFGRAANLIHLGRIHSMTEQPEKALNAFSAAIADLKKLPDRGMEAAILGELAGVLGRVGRQSDAERAYTRAISATKKSGSDRRQAELLNDIGSYELSHGRIRDARHHFRRALSLSRRTHSRFAESQALHNLARTDRSDGELEDALAHAESALGLVEELRTTVSSYRLRSAFVASSRDLQELHVSLLMELDRRHPGAGFDRRAFLAAELAKARSLLDQVSEHHVSNAGDPSLLQQAEHLRHRVADRAAAWDHHRKVGDEAEVTTLPEDLEELLLELERVESALRALPRETGATPLSDVAAVQRDFLDEGTTLLAYFLGRDESYLWRVTTSGLQTYSLPPRQEMERAARRIRALLAGRGRRAGETAVAHRRRVREDEREYWRLSAPLADTLLGAALRDDGTDRLLIAADGALHELPFSILPLPGPTGDPPRPLITRYEVVRVASASVWDAILRRGETRGERAKRLALIADPVFDAEDPRVQSASSSDAEAADPCARGGCRSATQRLREGLELSGSTLPRLLSTRAEANAISDLLQPEDQLRAEGFGARRTLVTDGELADYDVVHFATHGLLSSERPELSGIALSLVDETGRSENGFLRLGDIERLDLPVRLVVLSACDTALGKEVPGEGVVGLVSGFLTAGADGVVASYWKVEDEATAELMRSFYTGLLSDRLPPPTALRRAQRAMLERHRWDSPYFFGAFEFHGSWR